MQTIDLEDQGLRTLNETLQAQAADTNQTEWLITNPRGSHAIALVWMPRSMSPSRDRPDITAAA